MKFVTLKSPFIMASLMALVSGASVMAKEGISTSQLRGAVTAKAPAPYSTNLYAGPETVAPLHDIYVYIEVQTPEGLSVRDGTFVTLSHFGAEGEEQLFGKTKYGLASFVIPSGKVSGDKIFKAVSKGVMTSTMSVNVTSGEVVKIPTRFEYDSVSNDLILDAGPLKDVFGNVIENGSTLTLSVLTETGQSGYETALVHHGFARWILPCVRYPAGLKTLTVTLKDVTETVPLPKKSCRPELLNYRIGA